MQSFKEAAQEKNSFLWRWTLLQNLIYSLRAAAVRSVFCTHLPAAADLSKDHLTSSVNQVLLCFDKLRQQLTYSYMLFVLLIDINFRFCIRIYNNGLHLYQTQWLIQNGVGSKCLTLYLSKAVNFTKKMQNISAF